MAHFAGKLRPELEPLEDRWLPSITFQFDYSLDANNFFSTQARRNLLDTAGHLLTDRLQDTLDAINPSGGNSWSVSITDPATGSQRDLGNLAIPADTIVVYVGGRNFHGGTLAVGGPGSYSASGSQAWLDNIQARGELGALGSDANQTDFAPATGSISFDSVGTAWHFGATTAGLGANEADFLSTAVHELGHALGIGTAASWDRLVSSGVFTGQASVASFGGNVPLGPDRAHWAEGTQSGGGEAAMDPSLTLGTRKLFTDLDFSGLRDIGWDVTSLSTPTVLVAPLSGLVTTERGDIASFTVVLNTVPAADVVIHLQSSNPSEGTLSAATLTFTPANALTPQVVTVTGVADHVIDGNVAYTIAIGPVVSGDANYSVLDPPDVSLVNLDDIAVTQPVTGTSGVTDVSGVVSVQRGRLRFDPRTGRWRQMIRLVNLGGTPIRGHISLIVVLGGRKVKLLGPTGFSLEQQPGSPYLDVVNLNGDGVLDPGEGVVLQLDFRSRDASRPRYFLRILTGDGIR